MAGFDYKDEVMAEIYRGERIHEAENERLIRQAAAGIQQKRSNFFSAALIKLGKNLVHMGTHLQNKQMSRHAS